MRTILLLLALVVCFFIWDRLANDGIYTSDVERSFREAAADMPHGYGTGITFDRDLLKR
ncbi:hypothetical protein RFM26_02160 [Mesorhizobium sp. VK23B]|uniref:Uncharacterized protein n=1 Tax=Mesorhizobium dulcispinae TaxID=3072316 RepID=A0ABU4XBG2_9HYPH|nr:MULTISPECIES: hypothetical protein [unclassified Mesorhizobium]MDX8464488.1 hypothetical protein [Mesorhizobium sp. VK23B]MDX8470874.1 hypothetical protein [Mesorhizobium sp. VK23A]MDX8517619.1 hypothetical protein [Mesorhizobium sp. VK23D]